MVHAGLPRSSRITLVSVLTIQYSVDQCKCAVTFTVRPALLTMCYRAQRCEGEFTAPISLVPLAVARLLLVVSAEGDHWLCEPEQTGKGSPVIPFRGCHWVDRHAGLLRRHVGIVDTEKTGGRWDWQILRGRCPCRHHDRPFWFWVKNVCLGRARSCDNGRTDGTIASGTARISMRMHLPSAWSMCCVFVFHFPTVLGAKLQ